MAKRFFACAVIASLLLVATMSLGCNASPPTGPTPPTTVAVTAISPATGLTGDAVHVSGAGFLAGATVMLDGVRANVTSIDSRLITATTPAHAAGSVDVVVTNPGGQSATLTGGYTYQVVSLTISPSVVTFGGQLTLSWVAPKGRSRDWVGLYRVGDPNINHEWWAYTNGTASGTVTIIADIEPGQYEFRYLVNDDLTDVARSGPVTITAGGH